MYRLVLYERPWSHYLVFGAFAGYIAYEIATTASRARVLPQLLVLTFFTYWSTQFAFPTGMYGPDTKYRYLPTIRTALIEGYVPSSKLAYLGHLIYVAESTLLTNLPAKTSYYLLSVLVLTGTLLLLSTLDLTLPAIPRKVALYAALIFGCMSWTLGRGFHPNKLNFFYPLILLLGLAVFGLYTRSTSRTRLTWLIIGVVASPAIIFGHRFSAGAALVFLFSIAGFSTLVSVALRNEYESPPRGATTLFVVAYGLAILGNPAHQKPLLGRFTGLVLSVLFPAGGGGGPGRYSQLSLELLLANTSAQAILFALTVFGATIAIRQSNWEYDFSILWMGILSVLLVVSLVFNAADVQPQRFYALLGLFGMNIFAGITFVYLVQSDIDWFSERSVAAFVAIFAVLSLVSPIAGMHISPFGDDVPHFRKYDTHQLLEGNDWVNKYTINESRLLHTMPPQTELPFERVSETHGIVDKSRITHGNSYVYTRTATEAGIRTGSGLGIGDRNYVFLQLRPYSSDDAIYTNGGTNVYVRNQKITRRATD